MAEITRPGRINVDDKKSFLCQKVPFINCNLPGWAGKSNLRIFFCYRLHELGENKHFPAGLYCNGWTNSYLNPLSPFTRPQGSINIFLQCPHFTCNLILANNFIFLRAILGEIMPRCHPGVQNMSWLSIPIHQIIKYIFFTNNSCHNNRFISDCKYLTSVLRDSLAWG